MAAQATSATRLCDRFTHLARTRPTATRFNPLKRPAPSAHTHHAHASSHARARARAQRDTYNTAPQRTDSTAANSLQLQSSPSISRSVCVCARASVHACLYACTSSNSREAGYQQQNCRWPPLAHHCTLLQTRTRAGTAQSTPASPRTR